MEDMNEYLYERLNQDGSVTLSAEEVEKLVGPKKGASRRTVAEVDFSGGAITKANISLTSAISSKGGVEAWLRVRAGNGDASHNVSETTFARIKKFFDDGHAFFKHTKIWKI